MNADADPARDDGPASAAEESVWVASQLSQGAYVASVEIELDPPVEASVAEHALRTLSRRHPLLRARYVLRDRSLRRDVVAQDPDVVRTAHEPGANPLRGIPRVDVRHGPVTRFVLHVDPAGKAHRAIIVVHHIVGDRDAVRVLRDEFLDLVSGSPRPWSPSLPYAAYVEDLEVGATGASARGSDEYWRLEAARQVAACGQGRLRRSTVSAAVLVSVDPLGRGRRGDGRSLMPMSPWFAAGMLCAAAVTDRRAIPAAWPATLRPSRYARSVGLYLNVLPLAVTLCERATVAEFVTEVDDVVRATVAHSRMSVATLARQRGLRFPVPALLFEYLGPVSTGGLPEEGVLPTPGSSGRYDVEFRVDTTPRERALIRVVVADSGDTPRLTGDVAALAQSAAQVIADPRSAETVGGFVDGWAARFHGRQTPSTTTRP